MSKPFFWLGVASGLVGMCNLVLWWLAGRDTLTLILGTACVFVALGCFFVWWKTRTVMGHINIIISSSPEEQRRN